MIEKLRNELLLVEEGIAYMEESDTAWSTEYTKLCRMRRILKKAIRRLERVGA